MCGRAGWAAGQYANGWKQHCSLQSGDGWSYFAECEASLRAMVSSMCSKRRYQDLHNKEVKAHAHTLSFAGCVLKAT